MECMMVEIQIWNVEMDEVVDGMDVQLTVVYVMVICMVVKDDGVMVT